MKAEEKVTRKKEFFTEEWQLINVEKNDKIKTTITNIWFRHELLMNCCHGEQIYWDTECLHMITNDHTTNYLLITKGKLPL